MYKTSSFFLKTIFFTLLLLLSNPMLGQSKRKKAAEFNFEYSPSLSSVIFINDEDPELRWTHNFFAKGLFYLNKNLRFTLGLGYMNTRYHTTLYIGSVHELNGITTTRYFNYLVMPVGLKFNIGPIFLNPELGLAYNIGYHEWKSGYTQDQMKIKVRSDEGKPYSLNNAVLPVFMTIGYEIKKKEYSILVAVKGYLSMSSIAYDKHFYGFGPMVGIKL